MLHDRLPLDGRSYAESVRELERLLIRGTPDLSNLADIRAFLSTAPPSLMGERTAEECLAADDAKLRVLIHYVILGASAMADLHPTSRAWLRDRNYAQPPWDAQGREHGKCRRITYRGRLAAVVSWEPERSVTFSDGLSDVERRWVLAMAIGAGEHPDWQDVDLQRFAAYLTMGGASFAADRPLSDAEISEKYEVPEASVAF